MPHRITFADKHREKEKRSDVADDAAASDGDSVDVASSGDGYGGSYAGTGTPGQGSVASGAKSRSSSNGSSSGSLKNYMNMSMAEGPACLRKVPFEVQVIIALLIPVFFIVGILTTLVVQHQQQYAFIQGHIDLVEKAQFFEGAMMIERGFTGPYLAPFANNTNATSAALAQLQRQQVTVDEKWNTYLAALTERVYDSLVDGARTRLIKEVQKIPLHRDRIEMRTISGVEAREVLTHTVTISQGVIRALARNPKIGKSLPDLVGLMQARHYINHLGYIRACGNHIVSLDGPLPPEIAFEYRYAVKVFDEIEIFLQDLMEDGAARVAFYKWRYNNSDTSKLLEEIENMYHSRSTLTSSEWFSTMSKGIEGLDAIIFDAVEEELGQDTKKEMINYIIQMAVAIVITTLAAAFIVFWQVRIAQNISRQQTNLREVSEVVSSFVPKTFLRTMGTRSIMQINTGQHVNVATTMVFSDIRNFTNLSERMTNEKLFFWLQRYFSLMTRVTDANHGTIDKFIGDAIFSFFARPVDAVRCGIDMQSVVHFLNSTLSFENLVQLGIGIHHGVVAFGVFGDENRRTCTMVSSEVNLASRLEGLTKKYGVRILVSEEAMVQIDTANFQHEAMNPVDLALGLQLV